MAKGVSIHIGLNAVDPEHYSGWDGALAGCENDARDMEALAKALEYEPRTIILTKDATVARVTEALTTAAQSLSAGDTLLLTYSGHGGQVPDKNGDESKKGADEIGEYADEYDETWVLYDRQLVDDELYALWSEFAANVRIIVLSDSCHSGTVTRELPPWEAANVDPLPSRRLPMELQDRVYEENKAVYDKVQDDTESRDSVPLRASIALISGCMDNQTSGDGPKNGRFTGRLLEVWQKGKFDGSLTRLHRAINAGMPQYQTPNYYMIGPANTSFAERPAFQI